MLIHQPIQPRKWIISRVRKPNILHQIHTCTAALSEDTSDIHAIATSIPAETPDHVQIFPSTIYRASATHLTFGPISGVRAQAASMDVALRPSLSKTPERAASHEPVQVVMRYCKFG